jgi:alkanesulfonate monooxygenase SsuD/methylene tetrahydromethanopterin reductase-like flavin-dependent oxidoreductase (luciferase family)
LEALNIYYNNFHPSEDLKEPYTIGCINVIAAETDAEAEKISTSLIRMILGVMTGQIDYVQPPTEMTPDLKQISRDPTLQRMLKYAFIGSRKTVKESTMDFLKETGVDEVMVASHIYDPDARIHSYRIFSEIMAGL